MCISGAEALYDFRNPCFGVRAPFNCGRRPLQRICGTARAFFGRRDKSVRIFIFYILLCDWKCGFCILPCGLCFVRVDLRLRFDDRTTESRPICRGNCAFSRHRRRSQCAFCKPFWDTRRIDCRKLYLCAHPCPCCRRRCMCRFVRTLTAFFKDQRKRFVF